MCVWGWGGEEGGHACAGVSVCVFMCVRGEGAMHACVCVCVCVCVSIY